MEKKRKIELLIQITLIVLFIPTSFLLSEFIEDPDLSGLLRASYLCFCFFIFGVMAFINDRKKNAIISTVAASIMLMLILIYF